MISPDAVHSNPLILSAQHLAQIAGQILPAPRHEICGLMGGSGRRVFALFPVPNAAETPENSYFMEPREQVRVMTLLEARGWDIVAIYHSHPPGARTDPSPSDVRQAYYPGVLHVIIVADESGKIASLRAFLIDGPDAVTEVPVVVEPG